MGFKTACWREAGSAWGGSFGASAAAPAFSQQRACVAWRGHGEPTPSKQHKSPLQSPRSGRQAAGARVVAALKVFSAAGARMAALKVLSAAGARMAAALKLFSAAAEGFTVKLAPGYIVVQL
eukprot:CAMPEP_0172622010 /NCGR_PEP_ID=MMETSP1068-20121228/117163_1 /TAXON_ID=35684 /ORGANISM="Pseudopedinella elastica, Strain CCMP716" /LENGTH=121 /DNA_ID=CAMNT_0013430025 /DNA_START=92 /DNA_END=457 /DNA_ORIENTATION=+